MGEATMSFVLCIDNQGDPASLEPRKVYQVLKDTAAEDRGLIRVIDESGEDCLYPARYFVPIEVPRAGEQAFSDAG
jgi:hypothetical protein